MQCNIPMAFVTASASPSSSRLLGRGSSEEGAASTTGSEDWPSDSLLRKDRNDGISVFVIRYAHADDEGIKKGSQNDGFRVATSCKRVSERKRAGSGEVGEIEQSKQSSTYT